MKAAAARSNHAAALRILSQYRRLVLLGKASLPFGSARRLLGPDCVFHLYCRHACGGSAAFAATRRRERRRGRAPAG